MTQPPLPAPPRTSASDISELLRQALAGLLPGDSLARYLDHVENAR